MNAEKPTAAHPADLKAHQVLDQVIAELKRQRFGQRTIELKALDGVIVQAVVVERIDSHKLI